MRELQDDDEETKRWKEKLRKLKKRKKDARIEEEMKNRTLKQVCIEILNEDDDDSRRKRRRIEEVMKERDEDEMKQAERMRRLAKAESKKKELLKKMRKSGKFKITEEEKRKIEQRKLYWRNFREPEKEYDDEDTILEAGDVKTNIAGCNTAASNGNPEEIIKNALGKSRKDIEYPEAYCLKNSNKFKLRNELTDSESISDSP